MDLNVSVPRIAGNKLLLEGFIYVTSRRGKNNKRYWDCELVRRRECNARTITQESSAGIKVLKGPSINVFIYINVHIFSGIILFGLFVFRHMYSGNFFSGKRFSGEYLFGRVDSVFRTGTVANFSSYL